MLEMTRQPAPSGLRLYSEIANEQACNAAGVARLMDSAEGLLRAQLRSPKEASKRKSVEQGKVSR